MNRDDILWKAILEDIFDDFLRFFYPNADELFDFSKGFEYLDKELEQLFPPDQDQYKPRSVDKLIKVFTKTGAEEWILVHVEVQGYNDKHFSRRMFRYYSRIFDKHDKPITAFAIFTDDNKKFHPGRFEKIFLGTGVTYTFNTYKILEQKEPELLANNNPFAMVALTVKTSLKGNQINEQQLFDLKLDLAKLLLTKQIPKEKIRALMNFLRYYIRFENREMAYNFEKEVTIATQNNNTMGIEEFLLDRARKEGVKKGIEKEKKNSSRARKEMAKKLKEQGISVEIISKSTGLSEVEILKL